MIALSTSWKSRDCRDGDALVQAVVDAGFDGIELEYRIQAPVFQQMVPALERSGLKVVSVHNYFPIPPIIPHINPLRETMLLFSEPFSTIELQI